MGGAGLSSPRRVGIVAAMNPLIEQVLFPALPLVAGVISGLLVRKFDLVGRVARMTGSSSVVYSRTNRLLILLQLGAWLFLAVWCHPSNTSEVLAWFGAHPNLSPVQLTPAMVRGVFCVAVFFCAYFPIVAPLDGAPDAGATRS